MTHITVRPEVPEDVKAIQQILSATFGGVGVAVVNHVLATTSGPVIVVGEAAYYPRFGFVDASDHGIEDPTFAPPPGVRQVLHPESATLGPIEYPPPFLEL